MPTENKTETGTADVVTRDSKLIRQEMKQTAEEAKQYVDTINDDKSDEGQITAANESHDASMARWDELNTELDAMLATEKREAKQKQMDDFARHIVYPDDIDTRQANDEDPYQVRITAVRTEEKLTEWKSAFADYLAQVRLGQMNEHGMQRSVARLGQMERALTTGVASGVGGGNLIPTQTLPGYLSEPVVDAPLGNGALVDMRSTANGEPLEINVVAGAGSLSLLSENTDKSGTADPTITQITLTAYKYGTPLYEVTYELSQDSMVQIESIIREVTNDVWVVGRNSILTTGDGSSKPQGLISGQSTAQTVTAASATAFTPDEVFDVKDQVRSNHRGRAIYMAHDSVIGAVRKLKVKTGEFDYVWQDNFEAGRPAQINNSSYVTNQHMASALTTGNVVLYCGFISENFVVRDAGDLRFRVNPWKSWDKDAIVYDLIGRFDSAIKKPGAGAVLQLA